MISPTKGPFYTSSRPATPDGISCQDTTPRTPSPKKTPPASIHRMPSPKKSPSTSIRPAMNSPSRKCMPAEKRDRSGKAETTSPAGALKTKGSPNKSSDTYLRHAVNSPNRKYRSFEKGQDVSKSENQPSPVKTAKNMNSPQRMSAAGRPQSPKPKGKSCIPKWKSSVRKASPDQQKGASQPRRDKSPSKDRNMNKKSEVKEVERTTSPTRKRSSSIKGPTRKSPSRKQVKGSKLAKNFEASSPYSQPVRPVHPTEGKPPAWAGSASGSRPTSAKISPRSKQPLQWRPHSASSGRASAERQRPWSAATASVCDWSRGSVSDWDSSPRSPRQQSLSPHRGNQSPRSPRSPRPKSPRVQNSDKGHKTQTRALSSEDKPPETRKASVKKQSRSPVVVRRPKVPAATPISVPIISPCPSNSQMYVVPVRKSSNTSVGSQRSRPSSTSSRSRSGRTETGKPKGQGKEKRKECSMGVIHLKCVLWFFWLWVQCFFLWFCVKISVQISFVYQRLFWVSQIKKIDWRLWNPRRCLRVTLISVIFYLRPFWLLVCHFDLNTHIAFYYEQRKPLPIIFPRVNVLKTKGLYFNSHVWVKLQFYIFTCFSSGLPLPPVTRYLFKKIEDWKIWAFNPYPIPFPHFKWPICVISNLDFNICLVLLFPTPSCIWNGMILLYSPFRDNISEYSKYQLTFQGCHFLISCLCKIIVPNSWFFVPRTSMSMKNSLKNVEGEHIFIFIYTFV